MRDNYHAWDINLEGFPKQGSISEQLCFLVSFAVLAPSSHNSQPWKFTIKDDSVMVRADVRRSLPESDKNNRQLFISLGCAAENLRVAGEYYGLQSTIEYLPDGMRVRFMEKVHMEQKNPDHLIFSIPRRVTNRNPYTSQLPDEHFLATIRSMALSGVQLTLVTDEQKRSALANVVLAAGVAAMGGKGFRRELSHYVRSNITRERTGMPCFGFGIPTPVSFVAPLMMRFLNMNKMTRGKDEKLLKQRTPIFGIISSESDDSEAWMRTGMFYEYMALEATRVGISTAPMAAAIQIGEYYKNLQRILSLTTRPQFFFRMGYSVRSAPHVSPRIVSNKVTVGDDVNYME